MRQHGQFLTIASYWSPVNTGPSEPLESTRMSLTQTANSSEEQASGKITWPHSSRDDSISVTENSTKMLHRRSGADPYPKGHQNCIHNDACSLEVVGEAYCKQRAAALNLPQGAQQIISARSEAEEVESIILLKRATCCNNRRIRGIKSQIAGMTSRTVQTGGGVGGASCTAKKPAKHLFHKTLKIRYVAKNGYVTIFRRKQVLVDSTSPLTKNRAKP